MSTFLSVWVCSNITYLYNLGTLYYYSFCHFMYLLWTVNFELYHAHDIIIIRYSFLYHMFWYILAVSTRVLVHVDFVVSSDCYRILMIIVAPIATYPLHKLHKIS